MKRVILLLAIGIFAFFTGYVPDVRAADLSIRNLPDKGSVTLSGTVQDVKNEREFKLQDDSGVVNVILGSNKSVVLTEGDKVTVTGKVENGILGKHVNASNINVHKDISTAVSDAIETHTNLSMDKAKPVKIARLPKEGLVKLAGTVDSVKDEKSFALKDATGTVDVNIQSDENVVLVKGAAITVVGYVNDGLFGKNIRATHVIVTADAGNMAPAAGKR